MISHVGGAFVCQPWVNKSHLSKRDVPASASSSHRPVAAVSPRCIGSRADGTRGGAGGRRGRVCVRGARSRASLGAAPDSQVHPPWCHRGVGGTEAGRRPRPHAVSGGSAMSPVTVEQPRKLDISRTEPKSGCCASRQDPCSVSPLPGPACADSVGFQEKGAL